jgi:hypothetical protein
LIVCTSLVQPSIIHSCWLACANQGFLTSWQQSVYKPCTTELAHLSRYWLYTATWEQLCNTLGTSWTPFCNTGR